MLTIQATSLLTLLIAPILVSAHGHVTEWTINGQKKPGFNPSWVSQFGSTAERPTDNSDQGFVANFMSAQVACGGWSAGNGAETWDLDAGSTVTARWNNWDYGHKGPVTEYMARCPGSSCNGVAADSLDWFKISEATYSNGKWPTETITSGLEWSFKIPGDLAPGPYLVRHNLMSMHDPTHPQLYPVCFQANLKSSGSAYPGNTVRFPDAYNMNDAFKRFNIYWQDDKDKFVPPGPAVYSGGGGGAAPAPAPSPKPAPAPAPAPSAPAAPVYVAQPASSAVAAPNAAGTPPAVKPAKTCKIRVKRHLVDRSTKRAVMERHAKRALPKW